MKHNNDNNKKRNKKWELFTQVKYKDLKTNKVKTLIKKAADEVHFKIPSNATILSMKEVFKLL